MRIKTNELAAAGEEDRMTWESFYLAPDRVISYPVVGKVGSWLHLRSCLGCGRAAAVPVQRRNRIPADKRLSLFATTPKKAWNFQMHKTGETAHSSVICPPSETPTEARGMASAQLATAGGGGISPGGLAHLFCSRLKGSMENPRVSTPPPNAQPPNNSLG